MTRQNQLRESLALFDSIVNSDSLAKTSILLFLTKFDLLRQKLVYSPLENHFPSYNGGNNADRAAKYILEQFEKVNRGHSNVYP
jgi:guanine nucleotide-binding protein G(i) subunit alpha